MTGTGAENGHNLVARMVWMEDSSVHTRLVVLEVAVVSGTAFWVCMGRTLLWTGRKWGDSFHVPVAGILSVGLVHRLTESIRSCHKVVQAD